MQGCGGLRVTLTEHAWEGQPAYLIGGGPSLKSFDWSLLTNKPNVIVVNRAFVEVPTASVFFTEDARFLLRFPKEFSKEWAAFQGLKVWHCLNEAEIPEVKAAVPDLHVILNKRQDKHWSRSFADGLSYSSNSMVGAINIACLLGADPIFLLGVDCRSGELRMDNYHDSYKSDPMWEVGSNAADQFKSDFENWVHIHTKDRNIVNLINPDYESRVECWPKVNWKDVLKSEC